MSVILASASPRRAQLLNMLGLSFTICRPLCDESVPEDMPPAEAVTALARRKVCDVAARRAADELIVAADTLVSVGGRILGKPGDRAEAASMLEALSDRTHKVYTGVAVRRGATEDVFYEQTRVTFRAIAPHEIATYIETGEPMDKAGAYGIQGFGALFVSRIDGDFYNVMGLPLCRLGAVLNKYDVFPLEGDVLNRPRISSRPEGEFTSP